MIRITGAFAAATIGMALTSPALSETSRHPAFKAHDAYLDAMNANDLELFLNAVTDDIVFIAPNSPAIVGKTEVRNWADVYFEEFKTSWRKTPIERVIASDWAFERYAYTAVATPYSGGTTRIEYGNGLNIYRMGEDGIWRVARDVWTASHQSQRNSDSGALASCATDHAPC